MKNISPTNLLMFRAVSKEDPNQFLFEFKVLYNTYDYESDNQKLKLFPSTLKDNDMRWFMGLSMDSITTWAKMEMNFLEKYQEYCKVNDRKDELFKMKQNDEEIIEDYLDRFLFVQRMCASALDNELLKIIFIRGLLDSSLEPLNLMGGGNIYKAD